ncbi:MAG: hypothetical protein ACJ75S_05980 [Solirubrobacterales bacterium]
MAALEPRGAVERQHDAEEDARVACLEVGQRIELRGLARPDASGITSAKAERMLGWRATRSWRDYVDDRGQLRAPSPSSVS